ncbi:MAG: hypothetical protein WHU94_13785 [Thermogemmata sp.]
MAMFESLNGTGNSKLLRTEAGDGEDAVGGIPRDLQPGPYRESVQDFEQFPAVNRRMAIAVGSGFAFQVDFAGERIGRGATQW